MINFIELVGWVGTVFIILAYFLLVIFKKIDEDSRLYQWLNLLGAIGVGINVFSHQAWPPFALQVAWGIIAVISLVKKPSRK